MAIRGPAGVIHDIFVEPAGRRQGLGRMLVDTTVAGLVARGATQIMLSTADKHRTGQGLFASAGIRPTMMR